MEQTPEQRPRRRRKLRTAPLPDPPSKGRRSRSSHSKSPARASSAPRPWRKGSKEKELRRSSTAGESVDGILKRHGLDADEILGAASAESISVSPPHHKRPEPAPEPRSDGGSEDDLVASLLQMFAAPEGEHRRVITPPPPPRKSLSPWPADMQPPAADGTAADARSQTITELRRRSVDLAAAAVKDREARHKKDEERRRQSITGAQVGVLRQYEPHRNERRKSIAEEHRQIRDNEQRLQKAAAAARAAEAAAAAAVAEAAELSARRRADAEAAREAEEEARVARAARARIARQQERARYRAELDGATTDRRDDAENEEDPSVLPTSPLAGTGDRRDSFGSEADAAAAEAVAAAAVEAAKHHFSEFAALAGSPVAR